MAKPNYNHAKRQKEAARLARQAQKQQRKQGRVGDGDASTANPPGDAGVADAPKVP